MLKQEFYPEKKKFWSISPKKLIDKEKTWLRWQFEMSTFSNSSIG